MSENRSSPEVPHLIPSRIDTHQRESSSSDDTKMSVDPKENIDGAVSSQSLTSAICKLSSNSETISSSVNTSIL